MTRIDARPGENASDAVAAPVDAVAAPVDAAASVVVAEPVKKKGPPKKTDYPGLAGGEKLSDIPTDFNPRNHTALREENFKPENVDRFYAFKAAEARRIADKWDDKAKKFAGFVNVKDKKTAIKMQDHLEGLKQMVMKLAAQGDVEGLDPRMLEMVGLDATSLAALMPPTTEPAAEPVA